MPAAAGTSMAGAPNVRLMLSSRAENVLLVRQALSGLAETIGLDAIALNDISTAVTEACNNVVLHAYPDREEGPMEADLSIAPGGLSVTVRDRGVGLPPGLQRTETAMGIGLPVIRALSERVELGDLNGAGTEIRMSFAIAHTHRAEHRPVGQAGEPSDEIGPLGTGVGELEDIGEHTPAEGQAAGDVTVMAVAPAAVARTVLPRVLCTLAARAHFSTDRISDTQLVADTLVAHMDGSLSATHLSIGVSVAPRNLELRIGPLHSGRAGALIGACAAEAGPVLERLTDGHTISAAGAAEILDLRLSQRG